MEQTTEEIKIQGRESKRVFASHNAAASYCEQSVAAASQVIAETQDSVVVDREVVMESRVVLTERIAISKDLLPQENILGSNAGSQQSDMQVSSQESLMDTGSLEIQMEVSSQESVSSAIQLLSVAGAPDFSDPNKEPLAKCCVERQDRHNESSNLKLADWPRSHNNTIAASRKRKFSAASEDKPNPQPPLFSDRGRASMLENLDKHEALFHLKEQELAAREAKLLESAASAEKPQQNQLGLIDHNIIIPRIAAVLSREKAISEREKNILGSGNATENISPTKRLKFSSDTD